MSYFKVCPSITCSCCLGPFSNYSSHFIKSRTVKMGENCPKISHNFHMCTNFNKKPCFSVTKVWLQYRQICLLSMNLFLQAGFRIRIQMILIVSGSVFRKRSEFKKSELNRQREFNYSPNNEYSAEMQITVSPRSLVQFIYSDYIIIRDSTSWTYSKCCWFYFVSWYIWHQSRSFFRELRKQDLGKQNAFMY